MKKTWVMICTVSLGLGAGARAGDVVKMDRTIKKEPVYRYKAPRYALLVFGREAKDSVWLVHDGDTLYVDRDGNGDLTRPGKKVSITVDKNRDPADVDYQFEGGELRVGGKVHKGLMVLAAPISNYGDAVQKQPNAKAALTADPHARVYSLSLDLEIPGLGVGRVVQIAGPSDINGALVFGDSPASAPVIHFDGPLQISFFGEKPTVKLEALQRRRARGRYAGKRARHLCHAWLRRHDSLWRVPEARIPFPSLGNGRHSCLGEIRTEAAMLNRQPARAGPAIASRRRRHRYGHHFARLLEQPARRANHAHGASDETQGGREAGVGLCPANPVARSSGP